MFIIWWLTAAEWLI